MRRLSAVFALVLLAAFAAAPQARAASAAAQQLVKIDRTVGSGTVAGDGDEVHVNYTG
jgi:FKBP-type peptidyl-prolyl cis-trans isomerase FkpA